MKKIKDIKLLQSSTAGIYIVDENFDNNLAYIGKDKNIINHTRIQNHITSNQPTQINIALKENENMIYKPLLICRAKDMDFIEKALISYYMPKYNVEYIAKINRRQESTIRFVKKLKEKYKMSDADMKRLVSIIKLRSL